MSEPTDDLPPVVRSQKTDGYENPFTDDVPLVCGIENPEYCDTCQ